MKPMKELSVQVRLFNNRLRQRRLELGLTASALAKAAGVSSSRYGELEQLKVSAHTLKDGILGWRKDAIRLSDFHKLPPEELFPSELDKIKAHAVERRVAAEEAFALIVEESGPLLPSDVVSQRELESSVTELLNGLTPRDREVIERRFGIGDRESETHESIAQDFEITRGRIAQIEARALRRLRHAISCSTSPFLRRK